MVLMEEVSKLPIHFKDILLFLEGDGEDDDFEVEAEEDSTDKESKSIRYLKRLPVLEREKY